LHGQLAEHFALPSPKVIYLLPGKDGKILRRLDVRWEKWRAGAQKGNISETRKERGQGS